MNEAAMDTKAQLLARLTRYQAALTEIDERLRKIPSAQVAGRLVRNFLGATDAIEAMLRLTMHLLEDERGEKRG